MFFMNQRSFDFTLYTANNENTVFGGESVNSTVIVFSSASNQRPVELYVSNCPRYATCVLSTSNSVPTFTTEITFSASESTPEGVYPVSVFAVGGGLKRSVTYYLKVETRECNCTPWVGWGCGGMCGSDMYLSRTCSPRLCGIESRCAYNSSCVGDFTIESSPNKAKAINQKADFTIRLKSVNSFSDYVYLSTSSCPAGSVCAYSLNPVFLPVNGSASSLLSIRTPLNVVVGDFNVTTLGIGNETMHSASSILTIL
jgi:hypothetical protein